MSSLLKSKLRFKCRIDCILSGNLSPLVALVAKVIRPRKICMPMDCLVGAHTLASASVCRACRRNKSNASVTMVQRTINVSGLRERLCYGKQIPQSRAGDSPAVFFYSTLGQLDVETCCAWRTRRKCRGVFDARESGYSIKRAKKKRNDATANHETKTRAVEYSDRSQHEICGCKENEMYARCKAFYSCELCLEK